MYERKQRVCLYFTLLFEFFLYQIMSYLRLKLNYSSKTFQRTHLSKGTIASNKNVHNLWHPFSAHFCMLFNMVWSILFGVLAIKITYIEASDRLFEKFPPVRKWFLGITLGTKWITPCERAKLCQEKVAEIMYIFLRSHFWIWKDMRNYVRKPKKITCANFGSKIQMFSFLSSN